MSINVELLRKTLAYIEAHPAEWDQTVYRRQRECGTAYCFAGWAAQLHGVEWRDPADLRGFNDVVIMDGQYLHVQHHAAKILGIEHTGYFEDEEERDPDFIEYPLFLAGNDLDDLRRIVAELCAEAEGEASA